MDGFGRLLAAVAVSITIFALHIRSSRRPQRLLSDTSAKLLAQGQRKVVTKLLDVGGFFGVDIGGTLTKLVFFAPDKDLIGRMLRRVSPAHAAEAGWHSKLASIQQLEQFILSRTVYGGTGVRDAHLSFHMAELGGSFHFIRFETRRMDGALHMAAKARLNVGMHTIVATGGGAMKFADAAASLLGIALESRDEIDCLVKGMAFLMAHIAAEAYTFRGAALEDRPFGTGIQYPYLLVNIGSGVGFILVKSETSWSRVGGTSLGGGTYYGLVRCLTDVGSFDGMLDLAEVGDNSRVDLTVGDIYGGDYARFGLKSTTIAASFGKAVTWPSSTPGRPEDVSRSLLIMLSNNIGQLAYLTAVRYKCKNVFFAGNFLRHENTISMRTLAYAIQFWSKGSMEGLFLRHEGYCGALGAFLSTLESADEAA